jgi:hypothetical protein
MKRTMHRLVGVTLGVAVASLAIVGVVATSGPALAQSATPLVGTFRITPGAYSASAGPSGSYFRMLVPGGTLNGADTNYIPNSSSSASDLTYTLLSPGSQGGLVTGSYQPAPSPAFDGTGNALSARIIRPTPFEAINFSVETQTPDAQTATSVPAPSISTSGGHLTGNLEAFSASWNNNYFNQGSPKPGGTFPDLTAGPTGTYNSTTGAYTLTWTSAIVGGPFNGYTGQWVLAGTFAPAGFYITTTSLPGATRGVAYSVQLHATGGTTPYKWKRIGKLPKGLKLAHSGLLSGTPKTKHVSPGTYHFTVQATTHKSKGHPKVTATQALTLTLS